MIGLMIIDKYINHFYILTAIFRAFIYNFKINTPLIIGANNRIKDVEVSVITRSQIKITIFSKLCLTLSRINSLIVGRLLLSMTKHNNKNKSKNLFKMMT